MFVNGNAVLSLGSFAKSFLPTSRRTNPCHLPFVCVCPQQSCHRLSIPYLVPTSPFPPGRDYVWLIPVNQTVNKLRAECVDLCG